MEANEYIGKKFGKLTIMCRVNGKGHVIVRCRCECGSELNVWRHNLTSGRTIRCRECRRTEKTIHGLQNTPEWNSWVAMRQRCLNPKNDHYPRYGGRGIKICDRWSDFRKFLADMGNKPSGDHSIGRIDNDGDYTPKNCEWQTRDDQANNMSHSKFLEIDGVRMTAAQWAKKMSIGYAAVLGRLERGWSPRDAVMIPSGGKR